MWHPSSPLITVTFTFNIEIISQVITFHNYSFVYVYDSFDLRNDARVRTLISDATCKTFESQKRKHAFEPPNHASLSYIKLDLPPSLISITMIGTQVIDRSKVNYVMLDRKKLPRTRTLCYLVLLK